jgi:hypothetical protein
MNERISELEALSWEDIPCAPYWDGMPGKHELYTTEKVFNKEKFAELIVKECASICELNGQSYTHSFTPAKARLAESTSNHCGLMIKKHFGVE